MRHQPRIKWLRLPTTALAAGAVATALLAGPVIPAAIANAQSDAVPLTVNPLYSQAYQVAFGAVPAGDVRATYSRMAGITPDDGIVFARLFIPSPTAAHAILLGDNRGFSATPGASSRGVLAWNTRTGQVSLTVSHSNLVSRNHQSVAALPIKLLPVTADFHQDQARFVNEVGFSSNSRSNDIEARLSLLNPVTNPGWAAWSADYTLTIARAGTGTYRVTRLQGNGYPAIEAYYYPHYIPANAPQADVIAKRSVDPLFTNRFADSGGGLAAVDYLSWNTCGYLPRSLTIQCTNTRPYSHVQELIWRFFWGFFTLPSQTQWMAPWDTPANATNAL